jgi:hypothetical protein
MAIAVTSSGSIAPREIRRCIWPLTMTGLLGVMSRTAHPIRSIGLLRERERRALFSR